MNSSKGSTRSKGDTFMGETSNLCLKLQEFLDFWLEVEFLEKSEIFKLENDFLQIEKDNVVYRRPRFLSEDNSNAKLNIPSFEIFNLEDTSIDDNYFLKIDGDKTKSGYEKCEEKCPSQYYHHTAPKVKFKRIGSDENIQQRKTLLNNNIHNKYNKEPNEYNLSCKKSCELSQNKDMNIYTTYNNSNISLLDSQEENPLNNNMPSKILFNDYESKMSTYLHLKDNMEKLYKTNKTLKNFKTSDTSSLKSEESFELEIEYEEIQNESNDSKLLIINDETEYTREEIAIKMKALKNIFKSNRPSLHYLNFTKFFNKFSDSTK